MDDKTCRLEILRELKYFYHQDPHGYLNDSSIIAMEIEESIAGRNVKYLEQKGLAEVKWLVGGGFLA